MTNLRLDGFGVLPRHWSLVTFGDVLIGGVRNGIYKPKEFHGRGSKIVNMGELFANPRLHAIAMRRVELSPQEIEKSSLLPGDLLFARRSLVAEGAGKCSIVLSVDENTTFESSIIRARPDPALADSQFLYSLFNSAYGQHALGTIRRQVAVAGITGADLVRLPIPLPPINEQRAVVSIIDALESKIELNQQTTKMLEAVAQALFKSWFVDFDPVRAKLDGRVVKCDADLAGGLFPNKLIASNSEFGQIPQGWQVSHLAEVVSLGRGDIQTGPFGSQLHAHDYVTSGVPVIMPTNISNRRIVTDRIARVDPHHAERLGRYRIQSGDLVYSRRGDVEKHALTGPEEDGWLCGTGCLRIRPAAAGQRGVSSQFLSFWLDLPTSREWIAARAVGATMPNLNTSILSEAPVLLPPPPVYEAFERFVIPLDAQIRNFRVENEDLSELRNILLTRLFSGELRMRDNERRVEAAI